MTNEFVTTGFQPLDACLGGLRCGEITSIVGSIDCFRTTFAIMCALHASNSNIPVLYFSTELSKEQLERRIFKIRAEKNIKDSFLIDDLFNFSFESVKEKINELQEKQEDRTATPLVIIDYLDMLIKPDIFPGSFSNRSIMLIDNLKELVQNLNVTVISINQTPRCFAWWTTTHHAAYRAIEWYRFFENSPDNILLFERWNYGGRLRAFKHAALENPNQYGINDLSCVEECRIHVTKSTSGKLKTFSWFIDPETLEYYFEEDNEKRVQHFRQEEDKLIFSNVRGKSLNKGNT